MEKRSAGKSAPAGLLAVQQPPALAPLLQHHHRRHTRLQGEHHPPAEAPLLLIHQHPHPGNRRETAIGHGRRTEGPDPQADPRQGRPSTGRRWRPACGALGRGPQHGEGRRAALGGRGSLGFPLLCHSLRGLVAFGRQESPGKPRLRLPHLLPAPFSESAATAPASWPPLRLTGRRASWRFRSRCGQPQEPPRLRARSMQSASPPPGESWTASGR